MLSLFSVVRPGFEPRQTEPKTVVLPLHHRTNSLAGCKGNLHFYKKQEIAEKNHFFYCHTNLYNTISRQNRTDAMSIPLTVRYFRLFRKK